VSSGGRGSEINPERPERNRVFHTFWGPTAGTETLDWGKDTKLLLQIQTSQREEGGGRNP